MSDRKGWPSGAVEDWLRDNIWVNGRAQLTKMGFIIWHSAECEYRWKQGRLDSLSSHSGWQHQHEMRMRDRRMKAGV